MNIDERTMYLDRIGAPADATVAELQERHLATVAFENLSIHLGEEIVLDEDALLDKIVVRRRGGFCYELNGAFGMLLRNLGFAVDLFAGRVSSDARLGPPFDHLALGVRGPEHLLVDVGFGEFSHRPLRLDDRAEQEDPAGTFRLVDTPEGDVDVFREDVLQYRLELRPRRLADFVPTCWWQATSPGSPFRRSPACSLPTARGRVTLSGSRLIRTEDGHRTEEVLQSDGEILGAYREHFGIELERVPAVAS